MKAMQYSGYGDPAMLNMVEIDTPTPSAGRILSTYMAKEKTRHHDTPRFAEAVT